MMKFEFDPFKSLSNRDKHGIDFEDAQALWDGRRAVVADAELRELMIGRIGDRLWTAVFTRRGVSIRLISVRRARKEEEEFYEQDLDRGL